MSLGRSLMQLGIGRSLAPATAATARLQPVATAAGSSPPPSDDPDETRETRPLDLGLFLWLLSFTRPYRAKRIGLFVAVALRSLQLPLLAWLLGAIIRGPVAHGSAQGVFWGAAGFLALTVATQITFHFRQRLALELGELAVRDLRQRTFEHLQRMPMSFYHRTRLGSILSRVSSDAEAVRAGVQDVLFTSIVALGQMLVSAAMMLACDPLLFAMLALLAPPLWWLNRRMRRELSAGHRAVRESFSRVTGYLAESICGIRVTQAFRREAGNSARFRQLVDAHAANNLRVARASGMLGPLLELNGQLFTALLLALGGYRVMIGAPGATPGDLIQFIFLAGVFFQPLQVLGEQYNQALTAMAGAERLRRLLDAPPDWQDPPGAARPTRCEGRVTFDKVGFAYRAGVTVLDEISFEASPGQTVALVGPTGSGKSTLASLVAKFHLPGWGRLLIDGQNIESLDTRWYRRGLGLVTQQNLLFSGTVLDNVRMARPEASEAEVRAVLERLHCADLLERLPQGLATDVGEQGARLSLGQRQVVCFARAMLADPRILILDEATSALDVFTEARLQQALARLLVGRTCFVVAHRLSTVRQADLVLVLADGRIIERGTHDHLLAQGGAYAEQYAAFAQASAA